MNKDDKAAAFERTSPDGGAAVDAAAAIARLGDTLARMRLGGNLDSATAQKIAELTEAFESLCANASDGAGVRGAPAASAVSEAFVGGLDVDPASAASAKPSPAAIPSIVTSPKAATDPMPCNAG
ncbi:unnamed protein product, partial [Phaeothamnion confervicola]